MCGAATGVCTDATATGNEDSLWRLLASSATVLIVAGAGVATLALLPGVAAVSRMQRRLRVLEAQVTGSKLTDGSGSDGKTDSEHWALSTSGAHTATSAASRYSTGRRSRRSSSARGHGVPVSVFTGQPEDGDSIKTEHAPNV